MPGIQVEITRTEIERHLAAIEGGNPLTPSDPQQGWTGSDMLAVAGIGLLGAKSQGAEAWGADEESLENHLHGAALVYMRLGALAADGKFEAKFGDRVLAVVEVTTEPPNIEVRVISTFEG